MSLSRRLNRMMPVKNTEANREKVNKYILSIPDIGGIDHVLRELGLTQIKHTSRLNDSLKEGDIYDIVAANARGETIGLRQRGKVTELAGSGNALRLEHLSQKLVERVGALRAMRMLDANGIPYRVHHMSEGIMIEVGP